MPEAVQVRVDQTPAAIVVRTAGQQAVQVRYIPTGGVTLRVTGTGPQGPIGITGPAGITVVEHDADANVARPDSPVVYWVGSVQPTFAEPFDLWYRT